jgi:uncharacterized radical SAM superfamily Fe-S cluster-containing enzyme
VPEQAPQPEAAERSVIDTTESLCPTCFEVLDADYVERDGRVHLERACPEHGAVAPPVWEDADHFRWAAGYGPEDVATGEDTLGIVNRHACLAVVEVTTSCNLECSYCFASSGHGGEHLEREAVLELLDVTSDPTPRPVQFSGGEPTVRDDLPELVEAARDRGVEHVEVNTNGVRLAREDGYARQLADAGVTAVYLQFDGFRKATHLDLREADLREVKREAIDACRAADLPVILVTTVVKGVNDDELGDIVRYALGNRDVVRSVNLQPVARFGRFAEGTAPLSPDAVARRLAEQTAIFEPRDPMPVPCCSAYCQLATAVLPDGEGGGVAVTRFLSDELFHELGGLVDEDDWMELLAGTDAGLERLEEAAACCGREVPGEPGDLAQEILPVGITAFMDADSADLDRLERCCLSVPTFEDGLVPFCAYNMTDRDGRYVFRQRRGWQGRKEVS